MENSSTKTRVAIFVDGANLFKSAAERRVEVDYALLRQRLAGRRQVVSATYYGSHKREPLDDDEATREEAFQAMVRKAGFELTLRLLKAEPFGIRIPRGIVGRWTAGAGVDTRIYREKGIDVALVTELLVTAWDDEYDTAILVSGDSDFLHAVLELVRPGKEVEVASFSHSASPELRRSATRFVELGKLLS